MFSTVDSKVTASRASTQQPWEKTCCSSLTLQPLPSIGLSGLGIRVHLPPRCCLVLVLFVVAVVSAGHDDNVTTAVLVLVGGRGETLANARQFTNFNVICSEAVEILVPFYR